jgi:bla regulator protein blaR1
MLFSCLKILLTFNVLLLVYMRWLQRFQCFTYNRFFLLVIPIVAAVSVFELSFQSSLPIAATFSEKALLLEQFLQLPEENTIPTTNASVNANVETPTIPWQTIAITWYGIVAFIVLILKIRSHHLLYLHSRKAIAVYRDVKVSALPYGETPCSWWKYIFIPETRMHSIHDYILQHEYTHVSYLHTLDIFWANIVSSLLWINPTNKLWERSMQKNHELQVDAHLLNTGIDAPKYAQLLLTFSHSPIQFSAHMFNRHFLKTRIIMLALHQRTSTKFIAIASSFLVAVCTVFIVLFASAPQPVLAMKTVLPTGLLNIDSTPHTRDTMYYYNKYVQLLQQCRKDTVNHKGEPAVGFNLTVEQRAIATECVGKLTKHQLASLGGFLQPWFLAFQPKPKQQSPSDKQFEAFKDGTVYGVWLNDKKIANSELSRYTAQDIFRYDISKLYGAAKKGRSYKFQVNLSTKAYALENWRQNNEAPRSVIVWGRHEFLKNHVGQ